MKRKKTKSGVSASASASELPRQKLLASIDIFESALVASRYYERGETVRRAYITPEQLVGMVSNLRDQAVQWLPLSPGVVAVGTDANGCQRYLLVRPARRTRIHCEIGRRRLELTVHLPNLLAELVAERSARGPLWQKVAAVYAFGGPAARLGPRTWLHYAPLPNYSGAGPVCMGSVNLKPLAARPAAEFFERAYLQSTFTDHNLTAPLVNEGRGRKKQWRNVLDALKKTRGKLPLAELGKVKKYEEIFR